MRCFLIFQKNVPHETFFSVFHVEHFEILTRLFHVKHKIKVRGMFHVKHYTVFMGILTLYSMYSSLWNFLDSALIPAVHIDSTALLIVDKYIEIFWII